MSDARTFRLALPRRAMLFGAAALGAGPVLARTFGADEAGVVGALDPGARYLTELGFFEATFRVVLALVAADQPQLARAHLGQSQHASYALVAAALAQNGATPFEADAEAFARAADAGESPVGAGAAALAAIGEAVGAAPAVAQIRAAEALVRVAHAAFGAGVDAGAVVAAQDYRDAWGLVDTARARLALLAASGEAAVSAAGTLGLDALEPAKVLFPAVTAERVGRDASILAGAAARIQIAGLSVR